MDVYKMSKSSNIISPFQKDNAVSKIWAILNILSPFLIGPFLL